MKFPAHPASSATVHPAPVHPAPVHPAPVHPAPVHPAIGWTAVRWLFVAAVASVGCQAGASTGGLGGPEGGSGAQAANAGGAGGAGTGASGGDGGSGLGFTDGGNGGAGEGGTPNINPCGTGCLDEELCDGINKGLDDDCDGIVDEGCTCLGGQASSCFRGDSSYLADPNCNPGTMHCTENGVWGPCEGGTHAYDGCFSADPLGCHAINGVPFGPTDLTSGAGNFDDNADAGSGSYTVSCPQGVSPCPTPSGSTYTALQSGEYTVTYHKTVSGQPAECTFPLYIGAPGLRVELSWNFNELGGSSVDLDLHMKQPMSNDAWAVTGNAYDCGWLNCKVGNFTSPSGGGPSWFPPANTPPMPVNWYLDPVFEANTCFYAPRNAGAAWQTYNESCTGPNCGCHSPRLDLDNVSCSPTVTDPANGSFCAAENINIDFPPQDQWIRVAVHHYSHAASAPVKPNVKIFCDGALAADLGNAGFYTPEQVFSWPSSESGKFWLVADVLFHEDECTKECIVQPLYGDPVTKTPLVLTSSQASSNNGPAYPPVP